MNGSVPENTGQFQCVHIICHDISMQRLTNGSGQKKKRGKTEVMQKKTKSLVFFIPCRFHTLFYFVFFFLNISFDFLCFLLHIREAVKCWKMTKKKERERDFSHAVLFIVCSYWDNSGFCQSDAPKFPPAECSAIRLYKVTIAPTSSVLSSPSLIHVFVIIPRC